MMHAISLYQFPMRCSILGNILGMGSAYERRRYNVTSSLIGWAHTQKDPCYSLAKSTQYPISLVQRDFLWNVRCYHEKAVIFFLVFFSPEIDWLTWLWHINECCIWKQYMMKYIRSSLMFCESHIYKYFYTNFILWSYSTIWFSMDILIFIFFFLNLQNDYLKWSCGVTWLRDIWCLFFLHGLRLRRGNLLNHWPLKQLHCTNLHCDALNHTALVSGGLKFTHHLWRLEQNWPHFTEKKIQIHF